MTERFKKAYDALCDAFFKGTLAKGTCLACACGNIVAAAVNYKFDSLPVGEIEHSTMVSNIPNWWGNRSFDSCRNTYFPNKDQDKLIERVTGYNVTEMCKIETAFENTCKISFSSYWMNNEQDLIEDQYKGLCAVFDVLCKLDGIDVDYKERLSTHPKLVLENN